MITQAEQFQRARIEFEEASAAGCTIIELRRRKVALRQRAQREVARHTADLMAEPDSPHSWRDWGAGHMMRD